MTLFWYFLFNIKIVASNSLKRKASELNDITALAGKVSQQGFNLLLCVLPRLEKIRLNTLNTNQLKGVLRNMKLTVSGNKGVLVTRLFNYYTKLEGDVLNVLTRELSDLMEYKNDDRNRVPVCSRHGCKMNFDDDWWDEKGKWYSECSKCAKRTLKRQDELDSGICNSQTNAQVSQFERTSRQPSHRGGCLVICCDHIGLYSLQLYY